LTPPGSSLIDEMRARLLPLRPESIEIDDDSALHAGHPGAASGGGHSRLALVSAAFAGKPKVERHRMVYAALGDLMQGRIHALAIVAQAPGETTADTHSKPANHPSKGAIA
jgi:BolA protein